MPQPGGANGREGGRGPENQEAGRSLLQMLKGGSRGTYFEFSTFLSLRPRSGEGGRKISARGVQEKKGLNNLYTSRLAKKRPG